MGYIDEADLLRKLKKMPVTECEKLASEIRDFLIAHVAQTGGHLGPNLGVIELTIALHKVFDSPRDAILFDTGHQSYVHKILTGRNDFTHLRQEDGLSGYPSREESPHDIIENSHASTALSWADGIARGMQYDKENQYKAVAIIGDGAMTGGMPWEALNNISQDPQRPIVIILNDNGRSYSPTIGGIVKKLDPNHNLNKIRTHKKYEAFLRTIKKKSKNNLASQLSYRTFHSVKKGVKDLFVDAGVFDYLGIKYLGPIDGHNINDLIEAFQLARSYDGPIVVHALTEKGRGYKPAEEDTAEHFHAIGKIHPETGLPIVPSRFGWTNVFAEEIDRHAQKNEHIIGITAAMLRPVGLGIMHEHMP
ncbi:MAG: 1-deoxy-D-xylulose-5-phosphate synthase, partial [Actinomycetaceae bacterium]|nr:1-deoxy-D-xylulose-5-phosphate synthase [Actinomycetaceae bacterium]